MTNTPQNWEKHRISSFIDYCDKYAKNDMISVGEAAGWIAGENAAFKKEIKEQRKRACREMIEYMKKSIPPEDLKLIYFDFETVTSKAEEFLKKMS